MGKLGELPFAFCTDMLRAPFQTVAGGITKGEDVYIKLIWSMMSDDSSYYDALVSIAGDEE